MMAPKFRRRKWAEPKFRPKKFGPKFRLKKFGPKKFGRNLAKTPPQRRVTSNNRFGVFADDISEASEEDNVNCDTQLHTQEIEDKDIEEEEMSLAEIGSLLKLLKATYAQENKVLTQKSNPTATQVRVIQQEVANLLARQKCLKAAKCGGMAWLIENPDRYRARKSHGLIQAPYFPLYTDFVKTHGMSNVAYNMFKEERTFYQDVEYWNNEVIEVYRHVFPGQFSGIKHANGAVKGDASGRGYHDHLIKRLTKTVKKNDDFMSISKALFDLNPTPDSAGLSTYFQRLRELQASVLDVGVAELTDKFVIAVAQAKIKECGYDGTHLQPITEKWKLTASQTFENFAKIYEDELFTLWTTAGMEKKVKEEAHYVQKVTTLESEIHSLKEQLAAQALQYEQTASDLEQVSVSQSQIAGSAEQGIELTPSQFMEFML